MSNKALVLQDGKNVTVAGTINGQFLVNNGSNEVVFSTATAPTAGQVPVWSGSAWAPGANGAGTVTSVSGTANQVAASPTTGAVVLSLPSTISMTAASTAVPLSIAAGEATGTGAAGGALSLTGGAATAGNGAGGAVTVNAGARSGSGLFGDVNIGAANTNGVVLGGTGGTGVYFNTDIRFNNTTASIRPSTDNTVKLTPNTGNAVTLAAKAVTSGTATAVTVSGGESSVTTGTAGSLSLSGGAGTGTNTSGGSLTLRGGAKTGTGTLGAISIGTDSTQTAGVTIGATGITTTINGTAKLATLNATAATITLAATTGAGALRLASASLLTIQPADSTTSLGFDVALIGGNNNYETSGGVAGAASITGGAGTGLNGNGGNVYIEGGAKTGTGVAGFVRIGGTANTRMIQIGTTGNETSIGGTLTLDPATVIPAVNGGTGFGSYFKGNILYAAAAGSALSKLSIGVNGEVLAVVAGLPVWRDPVTNLGFVTINNVDQTIDGIKTFSKAPVLSLGLAVPFVTGSDATGVDYVLYLSPNDLGVSPTTRMAFQPRDSLSIVPRGFNIRGQANELGDGGTLYLDGGAKVVSGTINQAGSGSVLIGTNLNTRDIEIGSSNVPTVIKGSLSMGAMKTIITSSSTSASAGLRIPHGADVLSATNGDIWTTGSGLFAYISGVVQQYAPLASPTFTGVPLSTTAAADNNSTQIATTAYVVGQASSSSPVMDGSATVGTSLKYARADHVHPSDTSRAPLDSPTFTGTPLSTTAAVDTNTTQIATTAYVIGQGYLKSATADSTFAPLASPTFTGTVTLPLTTAGYLKTTSGGVISSSATVAVADLSGAVAVANGGTNNGSLSVVQGTVYYGNGSQLVGLAAGNSGEFLQTQGAGAAPQWAAGGGGGGGGTVTSITAGAGLSGGTITTSGTISMPNVGTTGTYGSASAVPVFTTDAQGRVTGVTDTSIAIGASAITSGTLALANGGTNASLTATAGGAVYSTASALAVTAAGTSGQFLQSNGAAAPTWADVTVSSQPYDISGEVVGTPTTGATVLRFVAIRAFTLSSVTSARFACTTGPTSTATFTINHVTGGVTTSKGTVTIATSATSGSGTLTSTSVAAGDYITVVVTTPAAITDVWFTLPGTV